MSRTTGPTRSSLSVRRSPCGDCWLVSSALSAAPLTVPLVGWLPTTPCSEADAGSGPLVAEGVPLGGCVSRDLGGVGMGSGAAPESRWPWALNIEATSLRIMRAGARSVSGWFGGQGVRDLLDRAWHRTRCPSPGSWGYFA